ncbi:MAG TPA: amidohydrolase [Acidimicrobiales bacterium]
MVQHPATDARGVLYRGGHVLTVDPRQPEAEALATRAGRIVAVGREADCRRALGLPELDGDDPGAGGTSGAGGPGGPGGPLRATADGAGPVVVDLGGRTLLPGFVDAHLQPIGMCLYAYHLDLSEATSISDVLDALSDQAHRTPPGEFVVGVRIDAEQLAERRLPHIAELDAVGGGRAVVLLDRDGHTSMGNTVALAVAGIRGGREDPPGGAFERDERGRLTGVCRETATRILLSSVPLPGLDALRSVAPEVFRSLAAQGITSISSVLQTDAEGPGGSAGELESVGMMIFVEDLSLGNHAVLGGQPARAIDARTSSSLHDPAMNRVVGGVKLYLDGTLAGRSAALHRPYADRPDEDGWLVLDPAVAAARMEAAHLAGLQVCVHAVGDAAVEVALDLFADLAARYPDTSGTSPRHRIAHASVVDTPTAERFAELGVVAVVQPLSLRSQAGWLADRLGDDRLPCAYPFRRLRDAGVVLAGSSHAPAEAPDVLAGITAAVTRHGVAPEQALTTAEAIEMYTAGGAAAQQRDHEAGRLVEGFRADLVVLSSDPLTTPPEKIADLDVGLTVVGGRVVHSDVHLPAG